MAHWLSINKDSAENCYFSVYNSGSSTLAAGEGCKWDLDPANTQGWGNWVEAIASVSTSNGLSPISFAGVVPQGKSIGPAEFGSIQVYGYHASVLVQNIDEGQFISEFQTAFDAASVTDVMMVPLGYGTDVAAGKGGYFNLIALPAAAATTPTQDPLWFGNYLVPIEQAAGTIAEGTTGTTANTGYVKAHIRCLN